MRRGAVRSLSWLPSTGNRHPRCNSHRRSVESRGDIRRSRCADAQRLFLCGAGGGGLLGSPPEDRWTASGFETFIIGTLSGASLNEGRPDSGAVQSVPLHAGPLAIDMSDDVGQLDYRKLTSAVGAVPFLQWTEGPRNRSIMNACSGHRVGLELRVQRLVSLLVLETHEVRRTFLSVDGFDTV